MNDRIFELLRPEDLSTDMRRLADIVGMDNARKVIAEFFSERLEIPGKRTLIRLHERYIREHLVVESDGSDNRRQIARALGVTVRHIERRISQIRGVAS